MAQPAYRVAKTLSGNSPPVFDYLATGTVVKDRMVVLADAGTVTDVADDATEFLGMATNSAAAGEEVRVVIATDDVVFSAAVEGGTFAETMRGSEFDYKQAGVALDETDTVAVLVVDEDTTDTGRVLITIPPDNRSGHAGASGAAPA